MNQISVLNTIITENKTAQKEKRTLNFNQNHRFAIDPNFFVSF